MNTRVQLWLDQVPNAKIIEEVRTLSSYNTADDNEEIEIIQDESDKKVLIIRFDSPKGKQDYLAGKIMKRYSQYLETYSDIAVSFDAKKLRW